MKGESASQSGYTPVSRSGDVVALRETGFRQTSREDSTDCKLDAEPVFSTSAVYDSWIWLLLAFAPVSVIVSLLLVWIDPKSSEKDKKQAVISLLVTLASVLFIFSLVLPKSYKVYSNASLGVCTYVTEWKFSKVVAAYENPGFSEQFVRPRFKFATSLFGSSRVLVRRHNGRWDVLVSPLDVQGFVDAILNVASAAAAVEVAEGNDSG